MEFNKPIFKQKRVTKVDGNGKKNGKLVPIYEINGKWVSRSSMRRTQKEVNHTPTTIQTPNSNPNPNHNEPILTPTLYKAEDEFLSKVNEHNETVHQLTEENLHLKEETLHLKESERENVANAVQNALLENKKMLNERVRNSRASHKEKKKQAKQSPDELPERSFKKIVHLVRRVRSGLCRLVLLSVSFVHRSHLCLV
jgi:hypothetical protein